ncbi:hypothetical protein CEUSTIGMA_g8656.t1 [Chlamydomonas eustigma]|uniref:Uncharacterized protein n=1 Tax=Chlamydomonas eustigma TaxID=1157962 RepID=A0A250XDT2_9CHLO|nr:hypothetical protein CEUSTIGMA_g8656.t1 [Chlamydomonas eustigma]|eukprot:GAX81224.1 hypothetical protein CEUSTIGMA_g8656.t1 [Chlamydomonas eustigma]
MKRSRTCLHKIFVAVHIFHLVAQFIPAYFSSDNFLRALGNDSVGAESKFCRQVLTVSQLISTNFAGTSTRFCAYRPIWGLLKSVNDASAYFQHHDLDHDLIMTRALIISQAVVWLSHFVLHLIHSSNSSPSSKHQSSCAPPKLDREISASSPDRETSASSPSTKPNLLLQEDLHACRISPKILLIGLRSDDDLSAHLRALISEGTEGHKVDLTFAFSADQVLALNFSKYNMICRTQWIIENRFLQNRSHTVVFFHRDFTLRSRACRPGVDKRKVIILEVSCNDSLFSTFPHFVVPTATCNHLLGSRSYAPEVCKRSYDL